MNEVVEKKPIEEFNEFLAALRVLGVSGAAIAKDGLGADDVQHVITMLKKSDVIIDGVIGADKLDDAVKNMDEADMIAAIAALVKIGKDVSKALNGEKVEL